MVCIVGTQYICVSDDWNADGWEQREVILYWGLKSKSKSISAITIGPGSGDDEVRKDI